jgi:hypothetical protein
MMAVLIALTGVAGSIGTARAASLSLNTTAPQSVRLDSVIIRPGGIKLAFTRIQRGGLVVFKVHNATRIPARFVMVPRYLGGGGAQGGSGGYQTKLLKPGELASFQIEFQLRGKFKFAAVDRHGKQHLKGTFLVT